MRFGSWIKRETRKANGNIAAGAVLILGISFFGPNVLEALNSTLLAGAYNEVRWFMLAALMFGLLRSGYGAWRRWELEKDAYQCYMQEHG